MPKMTTLCNRPVFLPPTPKMPGRKKIKSLEVAVFENGYLHTMEDYDREAIAALIECVYPMCDVLDNPNIQFNVQVEDDKLMVTCWKKVDGGFEQTWIPRELRDILEGTIHRVYPRDLSFSGWSDNVCVQFI